MDEHPNEITISVDGDDVLVTGGPELTGRRARLFFRSVLGATATAQGWRCPRRHHELGTLVVRINTFLEAQGWVVRREGLADQEVVRALERRRSFERTRQAAAALKAGDAPVDRDTLLLTLRDFGWSDERALRPHQLDGVLHALAGGNVANFSVPGSGKTVIALATAAAHLAAGTVQLVVVVGPLSSFRPWEHETAAALGNRLQPQRVRGPARTRRAVYQSAQPGRLLLVSYATAAADRLPLTQLCRSRSVMLVVDESHRIKRFRGGVWAPALVAIAEHARVRMILSGTPMPQSGRDLYSQLNVLWPDRQLTGPPDAFAARVEANFEGVLATVHPFIARTPKEALGLRPYNIQRHDVEMAPTQSQIYELILNDFRRRIAGAEVWADKIDALRRGRPIRLLQAATNPDLFNRTDGYYRVPRVQAANPTLMDRLADYARHETPAKTELALRVVADIADRKGKVVCWSNFLGNLDHFAGLVRDRLGLPCFQVDGRLPTDDTPRDDQPQAARDNPEDADTREGVIARFLSTPTPAVLVANPASCSESISLHQSCHNALYLDRTYDCAQFLQSIDRVHRLGLDPDATVQIHILRAQLAGEPTIDHLVDASLLAKEAVMRNLLEGANLLPLAQSEDPADDAEGNRQDLEALLRYLLGEENGS